MRLSNPDSAPWAYVEIARKIIADVDAAHLLPTVSFPALFVSGKNDYIGSQAQIDSLELPPQRIQIFGIPGETHFTSMLAPHMWKRVEMFLLQKNLD